jgi:phosphoribosyl-ATP pyrophosphohydrolase
MKSPTIQYIRDFTVDMEKKLAENRHKGNREGWINTDYQHLFNKLLAETEELQEVLIYKDKDEIISECADIANFAMMIADKAKGEK